MCKYITCPLVVQVFFHGGAFIFGFENMANGYWMMDHGVILVAVNYRLGISAENKQAGESCRYFLE